MAIKNAAKLAITGIALASSLAAAPLRIPSPVERICFNHYERYEDVGVYSQFNYGNLCFTNFNDPYKNELLVFVGGWNSTKGILIEVYFGEESYIKFHKVSASKEKDNTSEEGLASYGVMYQYQ